MQREGTLPVPTAAQRDRPEVEVVPVPNESILSQIAARGGRLDAPAADATAAPAANAPMLNQDFEAMPQSGAQIVFDDAGNAVGWVPETPTAPTTAAASMPAADINAPPATIPPVNGEPSSVPGAEPSTDHRPPPTAAPAPDTRTRAAARTLATQGVDEQTAAALAPELARSLPADLPLEEFRERVLAEFQAAGGVLPGSVPKRHVEQAASYEAAGYSAQDVAIHAENSRAANQQDVDAAHAQNARLRETLARPRVSMSRPAKTATQRLNEFWQGYASDPQRFQRGPASQQAELPQIIADYAKPGEVTVTEHDTQGRLPGIERVWQMEFKDEQGRPLQAFVAQSPDGFLNVNTQGMKGDTKARGGDLVYQAVLTYAHNTGRQFRPDPEGVSSIAHVRRLGHLLSSALRHGTTRHLSPHHANPSMADVPADAWHAGEGAFSGNVAVLAEMEMRAVRAAAAQRGVPISGLHYDAVSDTIQDDSGRSLRNRDIANLLARLDPAASGVGEKALLRAVVSQSTLQGHDVGRGAGMDALRRDLGAGESTTDRSGGGLLQRRPDEIYHVLRDGHKLLYRKPASTAAAGRVTTREAQDALRKLRSTAPALAQNATFVKDRSELRQQDYHPKDWEGFTGEGATEAFFDPRTGSVVVIMDNVRVREGETPSRAVVRAMLHERIGHAGLAALRQGDPKFQTQWDKLLASIEADESAADEIAALREQGYDHLTDDQLVEEWFARQVERMTPEQLNALKPTSSLGKLWQWFKDMLKHLTGRFNRAEWKARELQEMMALSRQALERGGPQGTGLDAGRVSQTSDASAWKTPEMRQIEAQARANGTWMKAPNGHPTKLTERQWLHVRTTKFKRWFGDWGMAELHRFFHGPPVATLDSADAPSGGFAVVREWAAQLFAAQGGKAHCPTLGDVTLDERAVRDSLAHGGANRYKRAAFAAIKDVLERGRVLHQSEGSHYVSAPVRVDGVDGVVTALVRQDANKNRLYLHSITTKENLLNPQVSGADAVTSERSGLSNPGDIRKLLHDILNFNPDSVSKVVDENGEPQVVYHGTDAHFDAFDPWHTADGAFWFASNKDSILKGESGAAGKGRIVAAFLNIRKMGGFDEQDRASDSQLVAEGFDGLELDGDYKVFNSTQIKSATANNGDYDGGNPHIRASRGKLNPFHAGDVPKRTPNWLLSRLRIPKNAPFRVQALGLRSILKGSPLPAELVPFVKQSERDIAAVRQSAAQIGADLNAAITAYAKRANVPLESAHALVAQAMEFPAVLNALGDSVLKERVRRARNFLDDLSQATAAHTGGELGQAILQNRGHWMRRSYAAFDPAANWSYDSLTEAAKRGEKINGVSAKKILDEARSYIEHSVNARRAAQRQRGVAHNVAPVTPGEVEAMMRQLTDRNTWESNLLGNMGGSGISKDTTDFFLAFSEPQGSNDHGFWGKSSASAYIRRPHTS